VCRSVQWTEVEKDVKISAVCVLCAVCVNVMFALNAQMTCCIQYVKMCSVQLSTLCDMKLSEYPTMHFT